MFFIYLFYFIFFFAEIVRVGLENGGNKFSKTWWERLGRKKSAVELCAFLLITVYLFEFVEIIQESRINPTVLDNCNFRIPCNLSTFTDYAKKNTG